MNPLATWGLGAVCAAGLTAGAVSVTAASSSTATPALTSTGSGQVAHLKAVKRQLQHELAAPPSTTAAPVVVAGSAARVTPATWVQASPQPVAPATTTTTAPPTTTTVPPATWVDSEGSTEGSDDGGHSTNPGAHHDD